jgi:hypothetical protein
VRKSFGSVNKTTVSGTAALEQKSAVKSILSEAYIAEVFETGL